MAVGETTEKARDVIANAVGGAASGAATGGGVPGAVGGAAKALVASRRGRRWLMVGLIVAVMSSPVGVVVAVLAFSGLLASTNETVQARSWDLAGALGTSPVSLGTIQAAADSVRTTWQVPWQVVWALWYYETGPGAGWGVWPGACATEPPLLPGASPLPCPSLPAYPGEPPPTTTTLPATTTTATVKKGYRVTTTTLPATTTSRPVPVWLGPFRLSPTALPASEADSLTYSAAWVADSIARAVGSEPGWWTGLSLASGIVVSQDANAPYVSMTSASAETVRTDMEAAISALPVDHGPRRLASLFVANVFELAQAAYLGWQPGGVATDVASGGMICGQTGPGGSLAVTGPDGSVVSLGPAQMANAAVVVHTGQTLGVPPEGIVIALGTALTESGLWDLPNPAVPGSLADSHAQLGPYSVSSLPSNGTSVGLFQQQDDWGPVASRMTPVSAAQAFFDGVAGGPSGLLEVPGWQSIPPGLAAQAVQQSAYPGRYQGWMPAAQAVLGAVEGVPCGGPETASGGALARVAAAALSWVGKAPYVWGGGTAEGPSGSASAPPMAVGQPGFDCSGLAMWAYAQIGVVLPHWSGVGGQWSIVQAAGGFSSDLASLQPGDLVFFPGSDGTSSDPGHVGIYLGHDGMVDALETGTYVEVDYIGPGSQFYASFLGGGPA